MPPGLTISMKTKRIVRDRAQLLAQQFIPFETAQQRAHIFAHELRADAFQPVYAAEKADGRRLPVGRAIDAVRMGNAWPPARTSQIVRRSNHVPPATRIAFSSSISGKLSLATRKVLMTCGLSCDCYLRLWLQFRIGISM